ncbi:MAG: hypothetical protein AABX69_00410 [Nanoarchaeota archaeon]
MVSSVDDVVATVEGSNVVGVTLQVRREITNRLPTLWHSWGSTGRVSKSGIFYLSQEEDLREYFRGGRVVTTRLLFADEPDTKASEAYAVVIEYMGIPKGGPDKVAIRANQDAVARLGLDQIAKALGYEQPQLNLEDKR